MTLKTSLLIVAGLLAGAVIASAARRQMVDPVTCADGFAPAAVTILVGGERHTELYMSGCAKIEVTP